MRNLHERETARSQVGLRRQARLLQRSVSALLHAKRDPPMRILQPRSPIKKATVLNPAIDAGAFKRKRIRLDILVSLEDNVQLV